MARTINIAINNRSGIQLTFGNPTSTDGPAALPAGGYTVDNGAQMVVTATNQSFTGGNAGTFTLTGLNVAYTIAYVHPAGRGETTVTLQNAAPGCVAETSQRAYAGDPANAEMNLYVGVEVPSGDAPPGYAVPLAQPNPYAEPDNFQDFANSMFGPNMRSRNIVTAAYGTPFPGADFSGQMRELCDALLACWISEGGSGSQYDGALAADDKAILNFLAKYIAPAADLPLMRVWVPMLEQAAEDAPPGAPAVYRLLGYDALDLAEWQGDTVRWNEINLRLFLVLFLTGAHFVAISATRDFTNQGLPNTGRDLFRMFLKSGLPQRGDPAHSHYASRISTSGKYYLPIVEEWAPRNCGTILALLFGPTVNSVFELEASGQYNTFMQLEGWQTRPKAAMISQPSTALNNRHIADFRAHQATVWNFSTYGACPYSEKRAATVFLAPQGWTPTLYQTTFMMPYVGAYALGTYPNARPQPWLDPRLIRLRGGEFAPTPLPPRYYENFGLSKL